MKHATFAFAAILVATTAHADDGFYNQPGWSDGSDNGTRYFHGDNNEYGWQSTTNGVIYYHSNRRNCTTTTGSPSQTSCVGY